jgi:hypothetical protein
VPGGYGYLHTTLTESLLDGLDEAHWRRSPAPGINPIAWLLWHMARGEDVGVNRLVTDGRQVLDDGGWLPRLGVARRDIGTGMTAEAVAAFSAWVDLAALRAYWDAVGTRTLTVVGALDRATLCARWRRQRCWPAMSMSWSGPTPARRAAGCSATWR